ncbi:MAG: dihydropteroate synthase [Blastocatellia bacterium]|nr:dihydropteroate synthase [Blastocatellia bacterium]
MFWKTSRRTISLQQPLVMGILNVTPDSFSDGGTITIDNAVYRAGQLISDGADILDIGGESTRPGSSSVDVDEELRRTLPVVEAIAKQFDIPISIDTTKLAVAQAAIDGGAEIINDISGLRWDERLSKVAAMSGAGLVLTHSRGSFETMHSQLPVADILDELFKSLTDSVAIATQAGVSNEQIVLDVGIGFGKTFAQNLELLRRTDEIVTAFSPMPLLIGVSRKSFLGKLLSDRPVDERLGGSVASALVAIKKGAKIVRVHDVKETVDAVKVAGELGLF